MKIIFVVFLILLAVGAVAGGTLYQQEKEKIMEEIEKDVFVIYEKTEKIDIEKLNIEYRKCEKDIKEIENPTDAELLIYGQEYFDLYIWHELDSDNRRNRLRMQEIEDILNDVKK